MEMKWMKSNIDNYKCSMLIFVVHQLFDKNTKKKSFCVFVNFVVELSYELQELSSVTQAP